MSSWTPCACGVVRPATPISNRDADAAARLAGFQRLAGMWLLSGGASAMSPSGNSNRSRAGTLWPAADVETMTEAHAAKAKRDIHLSLVAAPLPVKQNHYRNRPGAHTLT